MRPSRSFFIFAILFMALAVAGAQEEESLDEMFDDPLDDTVAVAPAVDHLSQYVKSETLIVSGSFNSIGGAIAGWKSWPDLADLTTGFDGTIGLKATANLIVDARPDPDFHLYGIITTSMDPLISPSWSGFSLGELFIDYTWLGNVFIRMGKHTMVWGQGRLFEAITNIVADTAGGFALRASMPTLLDGVSMIGIIKDGYFESALDASWKQIGYAVKVDKVVFSAYLSAAARYQVKEGLNAIFSFKKVVFGVDILSDFVIHYDEASYNYRVLAGFFKEWEDFKLYGEYYYTSATEGGNDHTAGLACGFNNILESPIDLGVQWIHSFIDGSGAVTGAITWSPWNHITATIGLPFVYGDDGTRQVLINIDPAKRRIALAFKLEMTVAF